GVCDLTFASGVTYTVIAKAAGYFDKMQTFALLPNTISDVNVIMIPSTTTDILAGEPQIVDESGDDVTATDATNLRILEAGKTYTAVFNVVFKQNTNGTGVYLRLGDDSSSTSSDNAVIFKGFPLDQPDLINSGDFVLRGGTSYPGNCNSPIAPSNVGIFKWIDAFLQSDKYNGAVSSQIKIPFIVTKSTPIRLNVSFRAYAVFNDGSYVRFPSDATLGPLKETPAKSECAADVEKTTYKVASVVDQVVQCTNQACLTLQFRQGSRAGGEGFKVDPAVITNATANDVFPNPLFLHYSILDFDPNFDEGTPLKFQSEGNFLRILQTANQDVPLNVESYSSNTVENSYTATVKTPAKVTGSIETHAKLQANPLFPIKLTYGSTMLSTSINLVGLPQQISALAALPSHYVLLYNASLGGSNDQLNLLLVDPVSGKSQKAESLDFQVDPLLPADALILLFNFSNAPCEQLIFTTINDLAPGCFEQVNDPRSALALPEEYNSYGDKMLMLKYDASTDACKFNSKNPNAVKITRNAAVLRAVSACTQQAIEIPLNIHVNQELVLSSTLNSVPEAPEYKLVTDFRPAYRAVTLSEKTWEEAPVSELGVDGSYIHMLYNNRQYSKDNFVAIFEGTDEATANTYFKVSDNEVIIPVQGLKPIVTHEPGISTTLLGNFEPDALFTVLDPALHSDENGKAQRSYAVNGTANEITVTYQNQPDSMKATKEQLTNVLSNTVFRRRQYCNPPHPCAFGMFPYSAFVDIRQKPIIYHLAGEVWTGKYGNGAIGPSDDEFSFYGLTGDKCSDSETGRNVEGVYDYYWQYAIDPANGERVQLAKFKPLETTVQDYDTFSCSQPLKLCGKLSINGGQCLRNCGDGWYYSAYPGVVSKTCSGNTFKVEDVRHSSDDQADTMFKRFYKNIPNALVSCFAQTYSGAVAGCAVGSYFGPPGMLIGTQIGGFVGGKAYDAILADELNDFAGIDPVKGDAPGFASFLGKWSQACSYVGTAMDVANAVNTLKTVASLGNYQCPAAFNLAVSKCFCFNSLGGFDPECAAENAVRGVVSSNAMRESNEHFSTTA
ncbi:MAG: hypothetical protein Q8R15_04640, partial [Candidatus Micrarchaeota archaeon]|nr:hypothetical protein [Candidatus Micrarchaeota archaeon]